MKYNQDYFYTEELLSQLSKLSGQPVMYLRADGPSNIENIEERNEVWEFYYGKCDSSILAALQDKGEVYCYFKTDTEAFNAFHEWFPQKSYLEEDEMKFYVYVCLVNENSGVNIVNG